jgi:hypothetical protein
MPLAAEACVTPTQKTRSVRQAERLRVADKGTLLLASLLIESLQLPIMKHVVASVGCALLFGFSSMAESVVVFNEAMYHPATREASSEWFELHNQNGVDVDLSGWSVSGGIQFTFPDGTRIKGRGYLVVASDPNSLAAAGVAGAFGPFSGRLDNGGEKLELLDRNLRVMDVLDYASTGPWPVGPDGTGLSLAKSHPQLGSAAVENWVSSSQIGGTPGVRNFPSGAFEVPTGLLSYWNFDESSGTALDLAGPNAGTLSGSVSRVPGLVGNGAVASSGGGAGAISLGRGVSNSLATQDGLTIEAAIMPTWSGLGRSTLFRKSGDNRGSLVSYLSMDESDRGTNAVPLDLVGRNHGVFRGTATRTNGLFGLGAVTFRNNTTEAINLGVGTDGSLSFSNGLTIGAWIKPLWVVSLNSYDVIFSKDDGSNRITFAFQSDSSNALGMVSVPAGPVLAFGLNIGGRYSELDMPLDGAEGRPTLEQLKDGQPHHVAATFDAASGDMGIWVDGTRRYQANRPGLVRSGGTAPAMIGNRGLAGGQAFTGVIDEFALWRTALSADLMLRLGQGINPLDLVPLTGPGNQVYLGFRQQGDSDFTDPVVTSTPVIVWGLKVGDAYREMEFPLDGLEGRPTLAALKDGKPHHLAGFYQPQTHRQGIALDGVVVASQEVEGVLDVGGTGLTFIGNSGVDGSETFQGTVDEVAYWNKGLSTSELSIHSRQTLAGKPFYAPVALDLAPIRFSEFPDVATNPFWVELQNTGTEAVDLAGLIMSGSGGGQYNLPSTVLPPGGFAVFTQAQFGFRFQAGDVVTLFSAGREAVLDVVRITAAAQARENSGAGAWRVPVASTAGQSNRIEISDQVVINEIFYHAPPQYSRPAQFTNVTLIGMVSDWKYNASGVDLGSEWKETAYNDGSWSSGAALFYNETSALPAAKNTQLSLGPITFYFRRTFTLTNDPAGITFTLRTIVDDGAVVYVNGAEAYRVGLRTGPVAYTNLATTVANATLSGLQNITLTNLIAGENVVAVEVHQSAANSDDMAFGLELNAKIPTLPAVPFLENPEQWIELYNRGASAINLAGWSLDAGVRYVFSAAASLPPGGYLVVARDPEALRQKYPTLAPVGPWEGRLSGSGERVVLRDQRGNPVDDVTYHTGGRWSAAADGGGSSLELRDPAADNSLGEVWAASLEGPKSKWQTITYRGVGSQLFTTPGDAQYQELVIGLLDAGEVLLDDVTVKEIAATGEVQLIQNPGFDTSLSRWRVIGNHRAEWVEDPDDATNHVMRMVATGMTEHMNNHAETTVKDGARFVTLDDRKTYEISLRARWISGSPQLNTRLYFNRLPRTTVLEMPSHWGTPGARNSQFKDNVGPTFTGFQHLPAVPPPGEPVEVRIRAQDPQGVSACTLRWSTNAAAWFNVPMTLGADGTYSASVPGHPAGRVVQFYIESADAAGAISHYPAEGPSSRALYQVEDRQANLALAHNIRIIMTATDAAWLLSRTNLMSNGRIGCTVVYDETEVFYDCGVRLKGSEHGRPQEVRIGFNLEFNPDQPFRGVHSTVALDRSGGGNRFGQDEILINHIVDRAGGVPSMHNDLIRMIGPTRNFSGSAILQMSRYNPIFLDSQYEDGAENPVFEVEYYYGLSETIPSGPEGLKAPQEAGVTGNQMQDLGDDKENYRLGFTIKNARDKDDFETIIPYLKMFSLPQAAFVAAAEERLDVEEWLRAFALGQMCGAGDNYTGSGAGHNIQVYVRPSDQKLIHLIWDTDFAFTQGAGDGFENNGDLQKLLSKPANRHSYYGHIEQILQTTYNTSYMSYWADHYDNFLPGQDFKQYLDYIGQRARTASNALPRRVGFGITSNGGQPFVTNSSIASIAGRAWVDVKSIRLAGSDTGVDLTWTTWTNWVARVPIILGSNTVYLNAYHMDGRLLSNAVVTVIGSSPTGGVDSDADGLPDVWENIHDLNVVANDAGRDLDRDGFSNLQEYLAGTDPRSAASRLRIGRIEAQDVGIRIEFAAVTGRSYAVEYRDVLNGGVWQRLGTVEAGIADRTAEVLDVGGAVGQRFYRIVTPANP